MIRGKRLPTFIGILGFVVTLGIMFWMTTNGTQLIRTSHPTPTMLEARLEAIRIQKADFPVSDAWQAHEPYVEEANNVSASMVYAYNHKDAFWIKVSQRIQIYPDNATARAAYDYEVREWFTAEWGTPPGLTFSGHADMMTIRCIEMYIENVHHYPCTAVSLYGDTVIVVLANVFDDRWFTMDDFAQLLIVVDQRMAGAMGE